MNQANFAPRSIRFSDAFVGLALLMTLWAPLSTAAQVSPPVSIKSIPFSGMLKTDLEEISVAGTLHLRSEVTLTSTTVFAKIDSNISQTTGVGTKSGQRFVGVGAPLNTCKIPAGPRRSAPVSLDVTSPYLLVPTGPLTPFYARGAQPRSLVLVIHATFLSDGSLLDASSVVGNRPSRVP
jgi:hypothetical protein